MAQRYRVELVGAVMLRSKPMFKISRISVFSAFVTFLTACGGDGGDNNPSASNAPGVKRVASAVTTSSFGAQDTTTYSYDENGRLDKITNIGEEGFVMSHVYDQQGRLTVREDDYTEENRRDTFREYLYEGNRPTGYIESGYFDDPISSVEYRYSGNSIVGYNRKNLDVFSDAADGAVTETGTYVLSDTGQIEKLIVDDINSGVQSTTNYVTNSVGQRISSETVDSVSPNLISTDWVYEEEPCIKFPLGIVLQWLCVQNS